MSICFRSQCINCNSNRLGKGWTTESFWYANPDVQLFLQGIHFMVTICDRIFQNALSKEKSGYMIRVKWDLTRNVANTQSESWASICSWNRTRLCFEESKEPVHFVQRKRLLRLHTPHRENCHPHQFLGSPAAKEFSNVDSSEQKALYNFSKRLYQVSCSSIAVVRSSMLSTSRIALMPLQHLSLE